MNEIILSKESGSDEIRAYFQYILSVSQNNEKFPIDLDEVWMLVYARRDNAVKELKKTFFQDIDYQSLLQKAEQDSLQKHGGQNKVMYKLSVPCFEYFIARKNREVFEVYRKVFHFTMENLCPSYEIEDPVQRALAWVEEYKERKRLEDQNKELAFTIEKQNRKVRYFDNMVSLGEELTGIRETAALLNAPQSLFVSALLLNGYCYRSKSGKLMAYSKFLDMGLFVVKERVYDSIRTTQLFVTTAGRRHLVNRKKHFFYPAIKERNERLFKNKKQNKNDYDKDEW